tara:strand:- start:336 stop:566 length:231 start_codon:yes stop_codon:yes gene_type:complete
MMSREDLTNFLHAVNHSSSLRKEISDCKSQKNVIDIAQRYGFFITNQDLHEDGNAAKINNWFKDSRINPIRSNNSY